MPGRFPLAPSELDARTRRWLGLFAYRAGSSTWREHFDTWWQVGAQREPKYESGGDVTVVLPTFRRPQNMELAAALTLGVPGVRRVVITNNDTSIRISDFVKLADPRVQLIDQRENLGPLGRYVAAREHDTPYFLSVDDDMFYHPEQLTRLLDELRADPLVPHGAYGQLHHGNRFRHNFARCSGEVDVLNRIYAFTREHLDETFQLLDAIGARTVSERAHTDDDVVVSFAGPARPLIHDLGPFLDCKSEARRGVALNRRPHADSHRRQLIDTLRGKKRLESRGPDAKKPPRVLSPRSLPLATLFALSGAGPAVFLAQRALGRRADSVQTR